MWALAPRPLWAALFPLLLALDAGAAPGEVLSEQKISDTTGGFSGALDNDDRFGEAVVGLADLDGDGVEDLAVGVANDDDGGSGRGAVWMLFLDSDGTVQSEQKISDTAGGFTGVLDNGDWFGYALTRLGDLDGDGVDELVVSSLFDDDGGLDRGAVWVLFLNTDGTVKSHQKISSSAGGFVGVLGDGDHFGSGVANLGDLDLDGIDELAVAAEGDEDGGTNTGAVWVLFLNADGTVRDEQKISDTQGGFGGVLLDFDLFGNAVAGPGDIDGDGVPDLAVAVRRDPDGGPERGAVWVVLLNDDGTVKDEQKISDTQGGFTGILDDSDGFGWSLSGLGDLDGDGIADLAVGAESDDDGGTNHGAVWVLFLNADGTVKGHQKVSETEGGFGGSLSNADHFGHSVAPIGDLDGDGLQDLAVGAYEADDGGNRRGEVWILFADGSPITCGDAIIDPVAEACDDGNTEDGDGCSALCQPDTFAAVYGIGQGGTVQVTVDGVTVVAATTLGESAASLAASLASLINTDPTLALLGTTASSQAGLLITNGALSATSSTDPGLAVSLDPGATIAEERIDDTSLGGALQSFDRFGIAAAGVGDLDGDGVADAAVGAPGGGGGPSDTGVLRMLYLNTDGSVASVQEISGTEGGFGGALDIDDRFGQSVAALGDVDGDGIGDVAVGAIGDDDGGLNRGAVWVLFLNADATVKSFQKISDTEGGFAGTLSNLVEFGGALAAPGDIDGDGVPDLVVAADVGVTGSPEGEIWVLFLARDGTVRAEQHITDGVGGFSGNLTSGDRFGRGMAGLGDLDGDGILDLAVGTPNGDDGGFNRGEIWILFLNADGTVKSDQKISDTEGGFAGKLETDDHLGYSLASLGDLDGDGNADLIAGANLIDGAGLQHGGFFVLFLRDDGTVRASRRIDDDTGGFGGALATADRLGLSVAALGDVNGDGVVDLAAGTEHDTGGTNAGACWILQLDGAAARCGNAVLDPVAEECDDGALVDGDGCSALCERESQLSLFGTANGGWIEILVDGVSILLVTSPGETPAQVIAQLAALVNADPTLAALGTTALALGNTLVSNGTVSIKALADSGLRDGPNLVPALPLWSALLCAAALLLRARCRLREEAL